VEGLAKEWDAYEKWREDSNSTEKHGNAYLVDLIGANQQVRGFHTYQETLKKQKMTSGVYSFRKDN